MFELDPGQMAGLGGGLAGFGKQFVSTDLARRRLALMEEGLERERLQAEERRRMLEEERKAGRLREEMQAKEEASARERETNILRDHVIPYLKEKGGKEWEWVTPEMAGDLPYDDMWKFYVAAKTIEKKAAHVKEPASAVVTEEKALALVDKSKYKYPATDGNTYWVYTEPIIAYAKKWGMDTSNMRTKEDVERKLTGKKKVEKGWWQTGKEAFGIGVKYVGGRIKGKREPKGKSNAERELEEFDKRRGK